MKLQWFQRFGNSPRRSGNWWQLIQGTADSKDTMKARKHAGWKMIFAFLLPTWKVWGNPLNCPHISILNIISICRARCLCVRQRVESRWPLKSFPTQALLRFYDIKKVQDSHTIMKNFTGLFTVLCQLVIPIAFQQPAASWAFKIFFHWLLKCCRLNLWANKL